MRAYVFIAAILSVSVFSMGAFAGSLPERVCKPYVSGNGEAFLQVSAKRDTVNNWREKVRELYGDDWANYSTAKVKLFPCNRSGIIAQACEVRAQPCIEVSDNKNDRS